jgi:hypothetical protein
MPRLTGTSEVGPPFCYAFYVVTEQEYSQTECCCKLADMYCRAQGLTGIEFIQAKGLYNLRIALLTGVFFPPNRNASRQTCWQVVSPMKLVSPY